MKVQDVLDIIEKDLRAAQKETRRLRDADAFKPVIMQSEGAEHALIALQCHIEEYKKEEREKKHEKT